MKKAILLLALLAVPFFGTASHIVGGEFEILYLGNFRYRINFIMYFDEVNGDQGNKAQDMIINTRIFRVSDNAVMANVSIPFTQETPVNYTQPACTAFGGIKTSRQYYTTEVTLSSAQYSDPAGYYIVWERCCRNYNSSGLINIYSSDPAGSTNSARAAGQTFYLQFPPVMKDGSPFVNSSPKLFPPLSDYGCLNKPYYADFRGTDDDGDSLVYTMTTPYNTQGSSSYPTILSAPYPEVRWKPPFSPTNIMGGMPDLRISKDGLLTVTPTLQGLFVFAVKVEEYRNNVKIGETRRDFQMLVIDCPKSVPPKIRGKLLADASYGTTNTMVASFPNTTVDAQRCINVRITDDDSLDPTQASIEKIQLKIVPLNFNKSVASLMPSPFTATLNNGSAAEFTICFPDCPFLNGDALIGIIAMDDACSLPLMDTLKVTLRVQPPPNNKPAFTLPNPNPYSELVTEGSSMTGGAFAVSDADGDALTISVLPKGFVLADAGMKFNILHNTSGAADGKLSWDAFCDIYNFTKQTSFQVTIQAEDADRCQLTDPAKAIFNLTVVLPTNTSPIIDTDLTSATHERKVTGITRRINESLKFSVTGKDTDNPPQQLVLTGKGKDFIYTDYGITITPPSTTGVSPVTNVFQWDISCTSVDLTKKDTFDFQFIVTDSGNKCKIFKSDTVDVQMKVLPPLNAKPQLSIANQNAPATLLSSNSMTITLGNTIQLLLTGTDADVVPAKDKLKLELLSKSGNVVASGYNFVPVTGVSPVQSAFTWQPDCGMFEGGIYENDYMFIFQLTDDHCLVPKKDSLVLKLKIKDIDGSDKEFIPPNFFSPNGDTYNDYFAMEMKDETTGEMRNILPLDNCVSRFESIRIYDRWGNQVYQSAERNFRWDGKGRDAGVYYYFLKFTGKDYRGTVSLRY